MSNAANHSYQGAQFLGVADSVAADFDEEQYANLPGDEKVFRHIEKSVSTLLDFLGMSRTSLVQEVTDIVSINPTRLDSGGGYGHAIKTGTRLGISGVRPHLADVGGASVVSAIDLINNLLKNHDDAVILLTAADIPKSLIKTARQVKLIDEAASHRVWENNQGSTLIGLYGLLANRLMFESGITRDDMIDVTRRFRQHAIDNPRAVVYGKELTDRSFRRNIASPYAPPMIAVLSDHGFAGLFTNEKTLNRLKSQGKIRKNLTSLPVLGASTVYHTEYLIEKAGLHSPSEKAGYEAFTQAGISRESIDHAWIYDCFTGMLIKQACLYFGLNADEVTKSLKEGKLISSSGKEITVNGNGGILNYQAAMSMSAATGLVDIARQCGLYANSSGEVAGSAKRLLLGGNGGIDSVNAVALFGEVPLKTEDAGYEKAPGKPALNSVGAESTDTGILYAASAISLNPSYALKNPYVIGFIQLDTGKVILAPLFESDGKHLQSEEGLVYDSTKVKIIKSDTFMKAVIQ